MEPERAKEAIRRTRDAAPGTGDAVAEGLGGTGLVAFGVFLVSQGVTANAVEQAVIGLFVILLGVLFYAVRRQYRDLGR